MQKGAKKILYRTIFFDEEEKMLYI